MDVVTIRYQKALPDIPTGWSWLIWEDTIDGHPKVFVRLRDDKLHCVDYGTIDVKMYGDGMAVVLLANSMVKRLAA